MFIFQSSFLQGLLSRNLKYVATLTPDNISSHVVNTVQVYGEEKYLVVSETLFTYNYGITYIAIYMCVCINFKNQYNLSWWLFRGVVIPCVQLAFAMKTLLLFVQHCIVTYFSHIGELFPRYIYRVISVVAFICVTLH